MSVSLNPSSSLGFHRPLTQLVKRNLTITNNNDQPVAFKVKTTAPKLYCVRPNAGRIDPGESVDVSVQLQPMKEEPLPHTKCKDKFLVQSAIITPDRENRSLNEIWSNADAEGAGQLYQQKIKVVYLPPEGQLLEEEEEPAAQPSRQAPTVDESQIYETVRQQPSAVNGHAAPIPIFDTSRHTPPPDRPSSPQGEDSYVVAHEEQSRLEETRRSASPDARQPSPGPIVNVNVHAPQAPPRPPSPLQDSSFVSAANVTANASTIDRDLAAKLAEAQEEIKRLRALLEASPDPGELRRRRVHPDEGPVAQSDGDAASEVGTSYPEPPMSTHQEGASPQQVGIVALLVFIITYLFF